MYEHETEVFGHHKRTLAETRHNTREISHRVPSDWTSIGHHVDIQGPPSVDQWQSNTTESASRLEEDRSEPSTELGE